MRRDNKVEERERERQLERLRQTDKQACREMGSDEEGKLSGLADCKLTDKTGRQRLSQRGLEDLQQLRSK